MRARSSSRALPRGAAEQAPAASRAGRWYLIPRREGGPIQDHCSTRLRRTALSAGESPTRDWPVSASRSRATRAAAATQREGRPSIPPSTLVRVGPLAVYDRTSDLETGPAPTRLEAGPWPAHGPARFHPTT